MCVMGGLLYIWIPEKNNGSFEQRKDILSRGKLNFQKYKMQKKLEFNFLDTKKDLF